MDGIVVGSCSSTLSFFQSTLSEIFGSPGPEGEVFEALAIVAGLGWGEIEEVSEEPIP